MPTDKTHTSSESTKTDYRIESRESLPYMEELNKIKKESQEEIRRWENEFLEETNKLKNEWAELYKELKKSNEVNDLPSKDAFTNAYVWYKRLKPQNDEYLTIADFHPHNKEGSAFYIINMKTLTVEYNNNVAHWSGSRPQWEEWDKRIEDGKSPDSYSNIKGSNQTSLWFFTTANEIQPWVKNIREWLLLNWKEPWINDNASSRWVYIHPAGMEQSEGCLILPYAKSDWQKWEDAILRQIQKLQWWSIVFTYDDRVFQQYEKDSSIFSWHLWHSKNENWIYIAWEDKKDIESRINDNVKKNESEGTSTIQKITLKLQEKVWIDVEKEIRRCWRIKKEVEMLNEQISIKLIDLKKKYTNQEELDIIWDVQKETWCLYALSTWWESFKKWFYERHTDKQLLLEYMHHIDNNSSKDNNISWIDKYFSVWDNIKEFSIRAESSELTKDIQMIIENKINEYNQWYNTSEKSNRRIPEQEQFNNRHPHQRKKSD